MLDALDADLVRRWCAAGLDALRSAREEIDALNVFPVPDGDTGTNLMLTWQAVTEALPTDELADLRATMQAAAHGALMGARGNSGVILSQLLRGLSDVFCDCAHGTGADLQRALRRAAELGYAAVAQPVEGTVLSVARAAADAAERCETPDLAAVARAAATGAAQALARTPQQLEALALAGVVDAGGRGLVVLLEVLAALIAGEESPVPTPAPVVTRTALDRARESGSDSFDYEVQYLLHAQPEAVPPLRERLAELGDSLIVVGGAPGDPPLWNVHVHVNDVGAAIEAGVEAGRPHRIQVTRFDDQMSGDQMGGEQREAGPRAGAAATGGPAASTPPCMIVTAVAGSGLRQLFEDEGAVVVTGGPTSSPSTQQLADAVEACASERVVVLPNDPNVHPVAVMAAEIARARGRTVTVIPTRSPVQGIAALAVHDPDRPYDEDVIAMTAAAGATRYGAVTVAARDAQTTVGVCREGDVLGLSGDDVALIGRDPFEVACGLLDRLLIGGGELVTLIVGADAPAGFATRITDYLRAVRPTVQTMAYAGSQPHYPLLLGVE